MQSIGLPAVDWWLVLIAALFVVLDFATGVIKAAKNKELSSKVLREGLYHKFGYAVILALGYLIEWAQGHVDLGFTVPLVPAVCVYIAITEVVSIFENLCETNPEFKSKKLAELLHITDEKGE